DERDRAKESPKSVLHEKLATSCARTKGRSTRSDVASLIGWSEGLSGHWIRLCEQSHTTNPACCALCSTDSSTCDQRESIDRADEVILARKGAKRRITGLRSKTTKARTAVDHLRAANADLKKKLAEALEHQAATSEVLGVISRSP